jgi:hypothetical protein
MLTLFKERNLREKYPIIEGKRTEMYRRENAVLTSARVHMAEGSCQF